MMVVAVLTLALGLGPPAEIGKFEATGRLGHPPLREASGIVASRRHPGIFWVHNDSGNPPAIFAIRRDGTLVREYAVAAPNLDWEDIATDDQGHLFVGDIGNNKNLLPLRVIHRLDEPDPAVPADKPLPVTSSTYYRFPDAGRFDAESLVIDGKRILLVAKARDGREAELYTLPLDPPAPLVRPALPTRAGTLPGFVEPATGADLSADGTRLAVCSVQAARVYRRSGESWVLEAENRFRAKQVEGIAWDGAALILVDEDRDVFRIAPAGAAAP